MWELGKIGWEFTCTPPRIFGGRHMGRVRNHRNALARKGVLDHYEIDGMARVKISLYSKHTSI